MDDASTRRVCIQRTKNCSSPAQPSPGNPSLAIIVYYRSGGLSICPPVRVSILVDSSFFDSPSPLLPLPCVPSDLASQQLPPSLSDQSCMYAFNPTILLCSAPLRSTLRMRSNLELLFLLAASRLSHFRISRRLSIPQFKAFIQVIMAPII